MVAPVEAASPPAAAPAQRASQAGPAVVDAEGRPVQLGARGTACAAKVCYGVLVFSSQDVDARRGPRCWGVHLRREGMAVPSVSGNGAPTSVSGPFRFSCTGKAVHAAREGPPGAVRPGAAVDLPYCEGLEVLASAKTEGGARPEAPPDGRAPHRAPPVPPREPAAAQRTQNPRPAAPPHKPPVVIDLTTFTDRFQAAAGKIAGRMAANANAIMSALGGGDGGPPKR